MANPKFATIFATNYSDYGSFENQLDGGRSATEEELHDAGNRLSQEKSVQNFFSKNIDTIQKVLFDKDGGVGFFLESLSKQIDDFGVGDVIRKKLSELSKV